MPQNKKTKHKQFKSIEEFIKEKGWYIPSIHEKHIIGEDEVNYQIKCVNKDADNDITHVGGEGFKFTLTQAIENIENRTHAFYTMVSDQIAMVYIAAHPESGKKFLKTTIDTTTRNNLHELPACP